MWKLRWGYDVKKTKKNWGFIRKRAPFNCNAEEEYHFTLMMNKIDKEVQKNNPH